MRNVRITNDPNLQICPFSFDHGTLVEKVLTTYAPHLSFTIEQLSDLIVLARFHEREDQSDKTGSKGEHLLTSRCLRRGASSEAVARYLRSAINSKDETRYRNVLLGMSPECVSGAKPVIVNPAQFHIFMADAVYIWGRGYERYAVAYPLDREIDAVALRRRNACI